MRTAPLTALVLIGLASATLTACAGESDATGTDPTTSPLDAYLYGEGGSGDVSAEQAERDEAENALREDLIAACMSAEGFDYIPTPFVTGVGYYFGPKPNHEPDNPEWVAQYGYGVVDPPWVDDDDWGTPNPNDAYVASLSPSDKAAYDATLWGPPEDFDPDEVFVPSGCSGEAQRAIDEDDPLAGDEFRPLLAAVMEFYTAQPMSAEMVALDAEWAECMADAGHSEFLAQLDPLSTLIAEVMVLHEQNPELDRDDPAYIELRDREVALALVDLDCRQQVDFRERRSAIAFELEEAFVVDHKSELEAYRAAAETAQRP